LASLGPSLGISLVSFSNRSVKWVVRH